MNARRPRYLVTASGNSTALDGRLFWRPIKACFRLFGRKKGHLVFLRLCWIDFDPSATLTRLDPFVARDPARDLCVQVIGERYHAEPTQLDGGHTADADMSW